MSKGKVKEFMELLFQKEGGGDPRVENPFGYIGKYQFGEDALVDLGYYKGDKSKNRTESGNFKYDWIGDWTGKKEIKSKDDFLNNSEVQDFAAKEWIALLCKRIKRFKLDQYVGRRISGVTITESGMIAAAHLKGIGSEKYPGLRQFLESDGKVDPKDGNKTPVSSYIKTFADYDLGCCPKASATFLDLSENPIAGLAYLLRINGSKEKKGRTDENGRTPPIEGLRLGDRIQVLVKRIEGGFKELGDFSILNAYNFASYISPKEEFLGQPQKHQGSAGEHKKLKQRQKGKDSKNASAGKDARQTKPQRNSSGHPVAAAMPEKPDIPISDKKARLIEVMNEIVFYGDKNLNGPIAVKRLKKGEKISDISKDNESISSCYKYVKIGLQASGFVDVYLSGIPAKEAGGQLAKNGFINLLDEPNQKMESPHDAPVGAVIVYDVMDGSKYGHIEIRLPDGFASDFKSERARTSRVDKDGSVIKSMEGRGRKVSGIWIKN